MGCEGILFWCKSSHNQINGLYDKRNVVITVKYFFVFNWIIFDWKSTLDTLECHTMDAQQVIMYLVTLI